MKNLFIAFALILSATSAQASNLTCGQLVSYKAKLAEELNWIRSKIRESRNSDKIEFLMGEYEIVYAKYQAATSALNEDCK